MTQIHSMYRKFFSRSLDFLLDPVRHRLGDGDERNSSSTTQIVVEATVTLHLQQKVKNRTDPSQHQRIDSLIHYLAKSLSIEYLLFSYDQMVPKSVCMTPCGISAASV